MAWLRRVLKRPLDARDDTCWNVIVDGEPLARLVDPEPDDMFWCSFKIEPLTDPPDPRLMDDLFWASDAWYLVGTTTQRPARRALASMRGIDQERRRVTLRGWRA